MPIYEYECSKCGRREELIRPMQFRNDARRCSCGKGVLRRVPSVPARNHPGRVPTPDSSGKVPDAAQTRRRGGGIYMEDVKFINNATAVKVDGPGHIEGKNIEILETPIGFDLSGGATVDLKDVKFDPRKRKASKA